MGPQAFKEEKESGWVSTVSVEVLNLALYGAVQPWVQKESMTGQWVPLNQFLNCAISKISGSS